MVLGSYRQITRRGFIKMKYKLKRLKFKISEYLIRKQNRYFGTAIYEEINSNPAPNILILACAGIFLYFFAKNVHYLNDFLYWFVGLLEITKILKIGFLDNVKYYQYLSVFVFFYLSLSLLWDLGVLLSRWNVRLVLVKDEVWMIQNSGFGKKLIKFTTKSENLSLEWNHSGLLNILGLNRIVWKKDGQTLGYSPYFFPYGKNKQILDQILKRA